MAAPGSWRRKCHRLTVHGEVSQRLGVHDNIRPALPPVRHDDVLECRFLRHCSPWVSSPGHHRRISSTGTLAAGEVEHEAFRAAYGRD